ncbi:WYL domain-containing protein [Nitratireductor thuwali]|uniref:WYL domain-containing protein n=1 Tax=Nitratireductor thuwali TaxID=2267699 RepID=UPI003BAFD8A4
MFPFLPASCFTPDVWEATMQNLICDAISNRHVLTFTYKGRVRTVEPHALGYDGDGDLTLCAWQLSGGSGQDFRDFHVDKLFGLAATGASFAGPRLGYSRDDKTLCGLYVSFSLAAVIRSRPAGREIVKRTVRPMSTGMMTPLAGWIVVESAI